ncbi:MAG TPA: Nif3-like dinuclear metal center hexameric protein [Spirochaetota bacterium]|nr:Nif3-like dinuclear metal center hexameric protein [Spirochaetota bacterium]
MRVQELTAAFTERYPIDLQESYDNSGEQVSFHDQPVDRVLVSLDVVDAVIDEAVRERCSLILTHHPFLFRGITRVATDDPRSRMLLRLIDERISVYSIHTNLDKLFYDRLGEYLGIRDGELLVRARGADHAASDQHGFGLCGALESDMTLGSFISLVQERLGLTFAVYVGDESRVIRTVGVINGAGGGLVERILDERRLDCIVTGDIGYHHARAAMDRGAALIDAGHYGTERYLLAVLIRDLREFLGSRDSIAPEFVQSKIDLNPFAVRLNE